MNGGDDQKCKKPYEKPLVTRVRLSVEHNVLQGCRGGYSNMSGPWDNFECFELLVCEKTPTL
jgi:hypothetical protein